jgi:hypothetical protein
MTVAVASTFFGVRLECARCHGHPYVEEWKQEHYYGLGAFLHRTESANRGGRPALTEKGNGELTYQDRGRNAHTAQLKFLDDRVIAEGKSGQRQALADYALNAKNPYFKRATVNRVWKQLMGVGLVEPVDQIHSANKPSHPKLFDLLADDFALNGFDLKRLLASVAFSPDCTRLASGSGDDTLKVWDAETGKGLLTIELPDDYDVTCVAFSPDGKRIASGGEDRALMVWDADRGELLLGLREHPDNVTSVAFSPDGKRIASASKATLKVWPCPASRQR